MAQADPAIAPGAATVEHVDVRDVLRRHSVEDLCRSAEEYFARLANYDYHLAKPLGSIDECPEILICFAQMVAGLRLVPGLRVLDFGAGSCWGTRWLTQLGLEVIAVDASASALHIGRELFARNPVFGTQPAPRFVQFDGRKIALDDESVDRVVCLDALHHVPNVAEVLRELARVLRPGGLAGFSEPGPQHSEAPQSQYEMRTFTVLENDIHIREIGGWARQAGFTDIRLAIFNAIGFHVSLDDFERYAAGNDAEVAQRHDAATRQYLHNRRLFFLTKGGGAEIADSRSRIGLAGSLRVVVDGVARAGAALRVRAHVANTGSAVWLGSSIRLGVVNLGVHLMGATGRVLEYDYFRKSLDDAGRSVPPGAMLELDFPMPLPAQAGRYRFEFDLVSEGVTWFAGNGGATVLVEVDVEP
jgi:2-polyprenyl-3-methyl-5-hydroxy-6-metoxy-1,4-benzoquinol methylase